MLTPLEKALGFLLNTFSDRIHSQMNKERITSVIKSRIKPFGKPLKRDNQEEFLSEIVSTSLHIPRTTMERTGGSILGKWLESEYSGMNTTNKINEIKA